MGGHSIGTSGVVLWADTLARFKTRPPDDLAARAKSSGYLGRFTASPVSDYTHPDTVKDLALFSVSTAPYFAIDRSLRGFNQQTHIVYPLYSVPCLYTICSVPGLCTICGVPGLM